MALFRSSLVLSCVPRWRHVSCEMRRFTNMKITTSLFRLVSSGLFCVCDAEHEGVVFANGRLDV